MCYRLSNLFNSNWLKSTGKCPFNEQIDRMWETFTLQVCKSLSNFKGGPKYMNKLAFHQFGCKIRRNCLVITFF